jgi:hypothetical protein
VNPAVGTGTRIELISFLPPAISPVTAVTVTRRVRSVPELVMNALLPLIRQLPSSRTAVVRVPPAPASIRPNAPSAWPEVSIGSQVAFCSSVPKRSTRMAPSETPAPRVMATLWSTRASSSRARQRAKESPPMPPCSSGNGRPNRPISAIPCTTS